MECRNCWYYDFSLGNQYCDKVGGKCLIFGYCEDAYLNVAEHKNYSKQLRRNKRERNQKHKKHLKFLAGNISGYLSPAIYVDEIWIKGQGYVENAKPYYKRIYRGRGKNSNSSYHKKCLIKKFGNTKEDYLKRVIKATDYMISGGNYIKNNQIFISKAWR